LGSLLASAPHPEVIGGERPEHFIAVTEGPVEKEASNKFQVIIDGSAQSRGCQCHGSFAMHILRRDIRQIRQNCRQRCFPFVFVELIRNRKLNQLVPAGRHLACESPQNVVQIRLTNIA
jgi:hypothetical protein